MSTTCHSTHDVSTGYAMGGRLGRTRSIGRPDPDSLELSATKLSLLEERMESTPNVLTPLVHLAISKPGVGGGELQRALRDNRTPPKEVPVSAQLEALEPDLVQRREGSWRVLVDQSPYTWKDRGRFSRCHLV